MCLFAVLGWPSLAVADPFRFSAPGRVIAFGDVHGALPEMVDLLRALEVVDVDGRWIGGTTHLVSLGDLLDRGAESRAVLDLLMDLQIQAQAAGGRVHLVLGNHETMNLTGDMRYVSAGEYAAFAEDENLEQRTAAHRDLSTTMPELADQAEFDKAYPPGYFAHRRAFSESGRYGRWLLEQPVALVVNGTAFVHGGLAPWIAEQSLEALNARMQSETARLLELGSRFVSEGRIKPWQDLLSSESASSGLSDGLADDRDEWNRLARSPVFGDDSPSWYRGTAGCHRLIEESTLEAALSALDATRVVVGHTPTSDRRIQSRFEGRALLADTGMLKSYYHGRASAVVFEGAHTRPFYPGERSGQVEFTSPPVDIRTGNERVLMDALSNLDIGGWTKGVQQTVELQGARYSLVFETGSRKAHRNRLAAFRLDKLLSLGLIPLTVERELDGRRGTLTLLPDNTLTERNRGEQQLRRSNWCGIGDDYQLMYAFDTLIGNERRSADDIHYDRTHWLLYLTGQDESFGSGIDEPGYLINNDYRLPIGLERRLRALGEDDLSEVLGDLLSKRALRALIERSRRLLERRGADS